LPGGVSVTATAGSVTAPDIILAAVPPTPTVLFRPRGGTSADFLIHAPKLLASNPTLGCSGGSTYNAGTATDFSASVAVAPDNNYVAINLTMPSSLSTCRVTTDDGIKQQTVDTTVDLTTLKERSNNAIRDEAFGGSAESNSDGQGCSMDFPMGSVVLSSGTVPTTQMVRNSTGTVSLTNGTTRQIFSDAFQLQIDSSAQLGTGKGLDITLPLNKDKIPDFHTMRIGQIINGQVQEVSGSGYCDPLTGRCTFTVNSLSNAPGASTIRYSGTRYGIIGLAPFANGGYSYDSQAAGAQAGTFVLLGVPANPSGAPYSGATMNAYNFPTPFDLTNKSLTANSGGTIQSSDGNPIATAIHYDLPAANGGHVVLRIFTISGELVRVLDQGVQTCGATYYATWDGMNMNGAQVASGVYFCVLDVPGITPKDHVIKLVVLK
jgi:hypothetical protein